MPAVDEIDRFYQLLGVVRGASPDEIRQAYLRAARKYHPDLNPTREAEETFKELTRAYQVLSAPTRRQLYDEFGEAGLQRNFDSRRARRHRDRPVVDADDAAILGRVRRSEDDTAPRSGDLVIPVEVDLRVAVLGGQVTVASPLGGARLTVKVPPGVQTGNRIRLVGKGHPANRTRKAGDLFLEVVVAPHPYYHREGEDLVLTLPVSVEEALSGTLVRVPTPAGAVKVKVPAGARGGERLRLPGKGAPRADGTAGDLLIVLSVRLPEGLDEAALKRATGGADGAGEPRKGLKF